MSQTDASPVTAHEPAAATAAGTCENCRTTLQGHYCHACGQAAHNPLKHVGHAIEEVFESFWHLDGRIFRTLRDLLVPGRVAANFLNGHRVGYVQPLRLFVILTLFTFFVGKLTLHVDDFTVAGGANSPFAVGTTAAEVEEMRVAQIAEIERRQRDSPSGAAGFAMAAVNAAAAQRIAELDEQARPPTQDSAASTVAQAAKTAAQVGERQHGTFFDYSIDGKPWDAHTNPVVVPGWPQFANNWLNRRLDNGKTNIERMGGKTDLYMQAILSALPGALFLLMPVFALVLRIAYVRRPMGYLEHLVVALYSHCWLMLVLLVTFLVFGIGTAIDSAWVHSLSRWLYVPLWLAVPVYLLWMQQRVYGGHRALTLLRYSAIGSIYLLLVSFVVVYAALAGISA